MGSLRRLWDLRPEAQEATCPVVFRMTWTGTGEEQGCDARNPTWRSEPIIMPQGLRLHAKGLGVRSSSVAYQLNGLGSCLASLTSVTRDNQGCLS